MALSIRPGSLADAEIFTGLVDDHHAAFTGEPLWSVDEIRAALITTRGETPVGVCINFVDTMRPEAGHIGMLGSHEPSDVPE